MAAPTIKRGGNFIEVSVVTEDVPPQLIFGVTIPSEGVKIKRIEFLAGANDDVCVIKETRDDEPRITTLSTPDVEIVDRTYFDDDGQYMSPYIDIGESILTGTHKIIFELA